MFGNNEFLQSSKVIPSHSWGWKLPRLLEDAGSVAAVEPRPVLPLRLSQKSEVGCTGSIIQEGMTARSLLHQPTLHSAHSGRSSTDREGVCVDDPGRKDGPRWRTQLRLAERCRSGIPSSALSRADCGIASHSWRLQSPARQRAPVTHPCPLSQEQLLEAVGSFS